MRVPLDSDDDANDNDDDVAGAHDMVTNKHEPHYLCKFVLGWYYCLQDSGKNVSKIRKNDKRVQQEEGIRNNSCTFSY